MSWNNVIPAWMLMPVRIRYTDTKGRELGAGFKTKEEALAFIHNEGDHIVDYYFIDEELEKVLDKRQES